ncbi:MBL fold metallo-hydrolase [Reyranella sp.]|uniref:MBL fold metallo-hydrolase n=1 Tax=Reyranella sp. TaxID=1929291 RepID=UPI003BAB225C
MRRIGDATIDKVEEINGPGFAARRMFPRFDQQAFDAQKGWMKPDHVAGEKDQLVMSIHSWIVRTPRHTILIDTCLGNHKQRANPGWNNLDTPFLDRLRACGCPPESVDFVMCTHLHVDHVGWNTKLENGRWVPTFPNARYLFGKREYAHWENERKTQDAASVNGGSFDDSVLPVVEAGKAVMIDSDHQPDPMLTIRDYPGHTPGSIAINLSDGGRRATFSGDIMHHPIQVYHPDWSSQFCWDQDLSARSRRKLLEDCAESGALLCPAHFGGTNAGYIRPQGDAFAIDWDAGA